MLVPNARKTWAPVGQTPILRHSYRRERISAIAALTVSPARQRLGLYFRFHRTHLTGLEVIGFLRHLLRHLPGPLVLLWDSGTIHRRVLVKQFLRRHRRLQVEPFPLYAPELNPSEFIWAKAKNDLSNGAPRDIAQLGQRLRRSVHRIRDSQNLLRSCIQASSLP